MEETNPTVIDIQVKYEIAKVMQIHPMLTEDNPYLYLLILQNPNLSPEVFKIIEDKMVKAKIAYDAKYQLLISQFVERGATYQTCSTDPSSTEHLAI